jgi:hypothetical protein
VRTGTEEPRLTDGDEYIDLAAPSNGVRSVHGAMQLTMGKVLSRRGRERRDLARISELLGTRFAAKALK